MDTLFVTTVGNQMDDEFFFFLYYKFKYNLIALTVINWAC